jgi:hypothetical protein
VQSAARRWKVRSTTAATRLRRRRRISRFLLVAALAPFVVVGGARASSNWCAQEAFDRPNAKPVDVSVNLWVPGMRCSLEYAGGRRADIVWPFDR